MYDEVNDLTYFKTLVADADQIPLLEAAAALALDEYPGLDLEQVLSDIDRLGQRLAQRCSQESAQQARLLATMTFFYKELGFAGNVNNFYDPDNSFIHKVIDSRRGIPISLAVLFIELAGHVGLKAAGVSFPGHFLVKVSLDDGLVVIDPFSGDSLSNDDIQERLDPFRANMRRAGENALPTELFLQVAQPAQILLRMLNNLQGIYRQQGADRKALGVEERMRILASTQATG